MKKFHPVKSPNDPKDYVAFELEKGLKLLIVSDSECDKAAASMSVGAGSMSDPDNIPGLAHLCEHLLSIEVNDKPVGHKPFNAFIAEHGGMFNAFTARDQTNFHFDVDPVVFPEALQRFLKFFTSMPSLSEKDIEREIWIVDSEHMSKANKDAWRKMAVDASTAKEGHPFQKFSTGNKTTLSEVPNQNGISVLNAAREFRSKYYVSNIMTVVIYAQQSLQSLIDLCVPLLAEIKDNKQITLPSWDEWPYGNDELRKRIDIVSVSDIRDFFIVFPMANMRPLYKTFPHGYLTRAIGDRSPGSLYSYLTDMQWVESSYMNASIPARGFGELSVGFQLTKTGMDHVDEIILLSFQYIKMLRDAGPQEKFWKEMQEVMYLKFLHQDKEVPVDFCQRMSNLMHVYPLEDVLGVGAVITTYDPSLIQKHIDYLDPENCRVVTLCKANGDNNTNFKTDHWYGAKYILTNFSEEQIQKWKFCEVPEFFSFPKENKFIPTNFDLKNMKQNATTKKKVLAWSPVLLSSTPLCKAWYLRDNEFQLAKGVIRVEISSPLPTIDPISYNLNLLWFLTLKNMMGDEFYAATVAGAYHGIKPTLNGVEITVSGFSDKLLILMEEIILSVTKTMSMSSAFKRLYETTKGRYATGLTNLKNLPPSNITNHYLSLLLRDKRFSYEELIIAMEDASEENLLVYMKGFFFRSYFEWMIYGNFTKQEAEDFICKCTANIVKQFNTRPMLPSQNLRCREVSLSPGVRFIFQNSLLSSGNSCSVLIQMGVLTMRESLITEIIDQIIFEPLFTQLRNKEHIGYIVRSSVRKSNGSQGLLIFLQGDKSPSLMSERIFDVLNIIQDRLNSMSPAEFNQQKSAVRIRKSEYPKSMLMLFNKLWNNEVFSRRYDFSRIAKELVMLEEITREDVTTFFMKHVSSSSSSRKVLQIHLHSKPEVSNMQKTPSTAAPQKDKTTKTSPVHMSYQNDQNVIFISDIIAWKMTMNLYPLNVT